MSHVLEIGIGFPSLGLPWWLSWLRIRLQCQRPGFDPWVGKIPWRKEQLPTPVFWPGKFHGLYSPWGLRESARLSDFYSFSFPQLSTDYRQLLLCQELRVVAGGQDSHESCSVISDSFRPHGLYSPLNSLGQNTGVGRLSLLQGVFPTQGMNPGLLHWRQFFTS